MVTLNRSFVAIATVLAMALVTGGDVVTAQTTPAAGQPRKEQSVVQTVKSKDGTPIAFERSGKGPVLILVSGALSDRRSGTGLAAQLAPHFSVINYDRRGRGSSGDTQPYDVAREVEDIEALIDHAGGSAHLFGASSGAALALEAASKLPGKVKKAALFEPPFVTDDSRPPIPPDLAARLNELLAAGRRGDAVEYFMSKAVLVPPEAVAPMRKSPMWPDMEKLAHTLPYDVAVVGDPLFGRPLPAGRWRAAKMPVLVLDGGRSGAWMRNSARSLAKVLPDAKHRTLEGQDHSAPFTAAPVVAAALVEFFGR
ncbi:MAG TPA: alpha/beta hydrolase [Tepidisphaeraceae bacterium]|nr:alpha/beta hydrolase [Tepidisphaeraceae bacterium]